jgi:CubicO group peptidase (beta-lactamase class C family)
MSDQTSISDILKGAVDAGDVPGVIAAAATADRLLYEGAFGRRELGGDAPMTLDTICSIASMTKAVTGVCAMQLVERGQLDLDGPVARVLPELGEVQVLTGFAENDVPVLRPAKRPVTLRHLLAHTSGFVYDAWNAAMVRYRRVTGTPGSTSGLNAALKVPLLFDPGERWEYGIGIDWVGKAVEAGSGMPLGRYMEKNIFDPLEMTDTGFQLSVEQRRRLARVHYRSLRTGLRPIKNETPPPEFESGGGGLYSTVGDYLKFTQMILGGGMFNGRQLLKPETAAAMARNAIGDLDVCPLKTVSPPHSHDVEFIDGMKWGLTFLINSEPLATGRSAGSLSWAGLTNCYYWIDHAKKMTGVYLTQILPFCDPQALNLFDEFETAVYRIV